MDEIAAAVRTEVNGRFHRLVADRLDTADRARLLELLVVDPATRRSMLPRLTEPAPRATVTRLKQHLGLLRWMDSLDGKGDKLREVPIHPQLRTELQLWLGERPDWPCAATEPALLLNHRGARLTTRGASTIFHTIADHAALDDDITAHTARHTFATTLIRGGTDLVVVADLLGHQRLESVRAYTQPTTTDRTNAVNLLPTDR